MLQLVWMHWGYLEDPAATQGITIGLPLKQIYLAIPTPKQSYPCFISSRDSTYEQSTNLVANPPTRIKTQHLAVRRIYMALAQDPLWLLMVPITTARFEHLDNT